MTCMECKQCGAIGIAAQHPFCLKCGNRRDVDFRFLTEQEQAIALFLECVDMEAIRDDKPN